MTEAERMVWCAAFGATVGGVDYFYADGMVDGLTDDARCAEAKGRAARAVRLLGGPSAGLDADSMMIAAIAEHGLIKGFVDAYDVPGPDRCRAEYNGTRTYVPGVPLGTSCMLCDGHSGAHRFTT